MENGISAFLQSNQAVVLKKLLADKGVLANVDICNFSRNLLRVNPMQLKSDVHAIFIEQLRSKHIPRSKMQFQFSVSGEKKKNYTFSFKDALSTIVDIICLSDFPQRLEGIQNIPPLIVDAFVANNSLREWFFDKYSQSNVIDIRLDNLRHNAQLGFDTYIRTVSDLETIRGPVSQNTPPPRIDGGTRSKRPRYTHPLWNDKKKFLKLFPKRNSLLAEHTHTVDSLSMLLTMHGAVCANDKTLFEQVKTLSMLRMLLKEDIDRNTLNRDTVQKHINADMREYTRLSIAVEDLKTFFLGGNLQNPKITLSLQHFRSRAESLLGIVEKQEKLFFGRIQWRYANVKVIPVQHFLSKLDEQNHIASKALDLRKFLHDHDRREFFAFMLPAALSLYEVKLTIQRLEKIVGSEYINEYFLLSGYAGPVIVCRADTMQMLRMLGLVETFARGQIEPRVAWRVLLKHLSQMPPNRDPKLHDFALYCMARVICQRNKTTKTQYMMFPHEQGFQVYRYLPHLCSMMHNARETEERTALLLMKVVASRTGFSISYPLHATMTEAFGGLDEFYYPEHLKLRLKNRRKNYRAMVQTDTMRQITYPSTLNHTVMLHEILELITCYTDRNEYMFSPMFIGLNVYTRHRNNELVFEYRKANVARKNIIEPGEIPQFSSWGEYVELERHDQIYDIWMRDGFFYPCVDKIEPVVHKRRVPPENVTSENLPEHLELYRDKYFVRFLHTMLCGSESDFPTEYADVQQLLFDSLPKMIPLGSEDEDVYFEESFFYTAVETADTAMQSDLCRLSDKDALQLMVEFGDFVPTEHISEKLEHTASYVECLKHAVEFIQN